MSDEEFDRVIIVPDVNQTVLIVKGEPGPRGVSGGSGDSPVTSVNGETGDVVIDVGTGLPADWTVPGDTQVAAGTSNLDMGTGFAELFLAAEADDGYVQITSDGVNRIVMQAAEGQSDPLLVLNDENGNPMLSIAPNGALAIKDVGGFSVVQLDPSDFVLYSPDHDSALDIDIDDAYMGVAMEKDSTQYVLLEVDGATTKALLQAGVGQTNPLVSLLTETGAEGLNFVQHATGGGDLSIRYGEASSQVDLWAYDNGEAGLILSGGGSGYIDLERDDDETYLHIRASEGQSDPSFVLKNQNGDELVSIVAADYADSDGLRVTLTAPADQNGDTILEIIAGTGNQIFEVTEIGYLYLYNQLDGAPKVVLAGGPTNTTISATAVAAQTDSLFVANDENGIPVFAVAPDGQAEWASPDGTNNVAIYAYDDEVDATFSVAGASVNINVDDGVGAGAGARIRATALAGQTRPLLLLEASGGADVFAVGPDGQLGFNGAAATAQHAAIADAVDPATTMAALNTLLAYLRLRGDIAA